MAENIKTIQLRLKSVDNISEITNAMKLVSMSKLMQYQKKIKGLSQLVDEFSTFQTENYEEDDSKPVLAFAVATDLGLAALYNNTIQKAVDELNPDAVMWIGTQGYEHYLNNPEIELVNQKMSSDDVKLDDLYEDITELMKKYRISIASPHMDGQSLIVQWRSLNKQLLNTDTIIYEPDYASANRRFQELYIFMTLNESYYQSKYTENLTRQMAMEQATDNAEDMREDLTIRYNQMRQEEITQEILELSAGVVQ